MSLRRALLPCLSFAVIGTLIACSPSDTDGSGGGAGGADVDQLENLPSPSLPSAMLSYAATLPESFLIPEVRGFDNTPPDNPVTDAGATLGRVLFYDRHLSIDGTVACATCHDQAHGFSDPKAKSVGVFEQETARHSMPLTNARFYQRKSFFWDERAASLEAQVLEPIQSEVEMGMTLDELEARLSKTAYYAPLFEAAFGDPEVSRARIAKALAQFIRSIVSYRSRWDAAVAEVESIEGDLPGFSAKENRGKEIFFGQHDPNTRGLCGTCHMMQNELAFAPPGPHPPFRNTAVFYMGITANNGLPGDTDPGVGAITEDPKDDGKFKSPSLRNVALRPPYMHDGRFETLAEVVEHYNSGMVAHPNLDPALRTGGPGAGGAEPMRLNLGEDDKAALVAFLETLTDESIATDARFSDPFPKGE